MVALEIEDQKKFTSELFVGTLFDKFLLREATVVTFNSFHVDGRIRQGYFSDQELELGRIEEYSAWAMVKSYCFSLIKGKRLPESFQIVLQLPPQAVERFTQSGSFGLKAEQIRGLYLNIRYEDGRISCVTGTSVNVFSMDRSLEQGWDDAAAGFLKRGGIPFVRA